jgi:hypothetical protein
MSTIVETNIEVTNLKYDSDTTSMIISSAGQVTIQGEGTATTNLQQGLAKHFILQENAGSNTTHNSFNTSSVDDHAQGVIEPKFTANMANANSLVTGGIASGVHNGAVMAPASGGSDASYDVATTGYYITIRGITSQSLFDAERYPVSVFGDLA